MPDRDDRDRDRAVSLGNTDSLDTTSRGKLRHLDDLDGFRLADGTPDLRGWDVTADDGQKLGEVVGLIVDTGARQVRYLEVKLDDEVASKFARANDTLDPRTEPLQHVLVPVGAAQIDDDHHDICLGTQALEMAGLAYRAVDAPRGLASDAERKLPFADERTAARSSADAADGRGPSGVLGAGDQRRAGGEQRSPDERRSRERLRPIATLTVVEVASRTGGP
ncbi:MAG TPA: PRC-barrel domain-containing protein [Gemmatimonadaceae bacterium]|jgi:hypothetical protein|nr:PRC-barrel domain-containing protein [Gemmatimonadaceae bacterium]